VIYYFEKQLKGIMTKTILITGASSFLGKHVIPRLKKEIFMGRLSYNILTPSSKELNLSNLESVVEYFKQYKPNIILHMAAKCGGIGANKDNPALFVHDNLKMIINLFDAIRIANHWQDNSTKIIPTESPVTHFYGLGSVCGYPKHCPVPFKECDLWNGYPEDTNAGYGNAKRMLLIMQQTFRDQFGLKGAHLVPVNMYGECDHFDPRNSHVIPALIRKFSDAVWHNTPSVEVWGDGTATREFLYAGDCAKAICKVLLGEFDITEPVNIGTGKSISIKDLAELVKVLTGYDGEIVFKGDVDMNGQPVRQLDVSRAKQIFGFEAEVLLKDGLLKTIKWVQHANIFKYDDRVIKFNNKKALDAIERQLGYLPEHLTFGYEKNLHEIREFSRQQIIKVRKKC
jgi:GDP-L-fucose synthase